MAMIAITVSKNLREDGTQEFVSLLNQISSSQLDEMDRLNGRTFEKFQQEHVILASCSKTRLNGLRKCCAVNLTKSWLNSVLIFLNGCSSSGQQPSLRLSPVT
jgi:hypothetical protein